MRRIQRARGYLSARLRDESGYTLIELLVTMVIGVLVIGAGVGGIALAFRQTTGTTSRVLASRNEEVGLEELVRDLRQAVTCPSTTTSQVTTYPTDLAGHQVTGVYVSGPASNLVSVDMCDPAPGLTPQTTSTNSAQIASAVEVPVVTLVEWACNLGGTAVTPTGWSAQLAPETCQRTWAPINLGTLTVGGASDTSTFRGVTGLSLSGILGSSAGPQALSCPTGCSYVLTPGTSNSLSWLGFDATVATLQNVSDLANTSVVPGTAPITVRSGAALENFGT